MSPSQIAVCVAAFLVGAWMILVYNLMTGATIATLTKNMITTDHGVNNLAFFNNLGVALDGFRLFMRGENFWYLGGLFSDDWYPEAFAIASAGTLLLLLHPAARKRWRALLFPLAMTALLVVQSSFTVSGLWATHLFILFPLPQLVVASFLVTTVRVASAPRRSDTDESANCSQRSAVSGQPAGGKKASFREGWARERGEKGEGGEVSTLDPQPSTLNPRFFASLREDPAGVLGKVAIAAAVIAVALIAGKDVWVDQQYHRVLASTGGQFTHSDAIYQLAQFLDAQGVGEPIAMDWGIKNSVQIQTQGRINPIEIFQYGKEPSPVFFDWLYGSLTKRPDTLYIFHAEGSEIFPRHDAFLSLARKLDKKVKLEQTFFQRDGIPIYVVYSAR